MILSLLTGAIIIANASAFILLHPGPDLVQYISSSSVYSVFVWTNTWIVPSTTGFQKKNIETVRQTQFFVMLAGVATILSIHPSVVGASFSAILFIDSFMFYNYPMMYEEKTKLTQKIDFARACIAAFSLIFSVYFFDASTAGFVVLIVILSLIMATVIWAAGIYRAPELSLKSVSILPLLRELIHSFRQKSLRALLLGRMIEITSLLLIGRIGSLGALVSLKVGIAIGNTLASNARIYSPALLFAAVNGIYIFAFTGVFLAKQWIPFLVPKALATTDWNDAAIVLPIVNMFFLSIIIGIRNR